MTKYSVPDMSCGHCTAAIETAVKALDASAGISPDLDSRTVEITTTADESALLSALLAEGYPATKTA